MKRILQTLAPVPVLIFLLLFSACGSKSKDIPDYAWGKESYFAPYAEKGAHVFIGYADGRVDSGQLGMLDTGHHLASDDILVGENTIKVLSTGYSLSKYFIEEDYAHTLHMLWRDADPQNSYNLSLESTKTMRGFSYLPVDGNYCDHYYFSDNKEQAAAVAYLEALEIQPNQASQYVAKEHGGTKTYKATIGKSVRYRGFNKAKRDDFLALYLDCGAVVEFPYEGRSPKIEGRIIDCVTDKNNRIMIHELI